MKSRLLLGAFIALILGCGDSAGIERDDVRGGGGQGGAAGADGVAGTAGDGGAAGTAGDGGAAGTAGVGGTAGSAGSGGAVPIAIAIAEYYLACSRDEPDDVFAGCLERRAGHFQKECGQLHLDHFVCLNDGNGADPNGDCERLLGAWVACVDEAYPAVRARVACSEQVTGWYRNTRQAYRISTTTYFPSNARAPNDGQRETRLEICDVERLFRAPPCTSPEYSSSYCIDADDEPRPCRAVLGALANTQPGCRPLPDGAPCGYRDSFSRDKVDGQPLCSGFGHFKADVFEVQTPLMP